MSNVNPIVYVHQIAHDGLSRAPHKLHLDPRPFPGQSCSQDEARSTMQSHPDIILTLAFTSIQLPFSPHTYNHIVTTHTSDHQHPLPSPLAPTITFTPRSILALRLPQRVWNIKSSNRFIPVHSSTGYGSSRCPSLINPGSTPTIETMPLLTRIEFRYGKAGLGWARLYKIVRYTASRHDMRIKRVGWGILDLKLLVNVAWSL